MKKKKIFLLQGVQTGILAYPTYEFIILPLNKIGAKIDSSVNSIQDNVATISSSIPDFLDYDDGISNFGELENFAKIVSNSIIKDLNSAPKKDYLLNLASQQKLMNVYEENLKQAINYESVLKVKDVNNVILTLESAISKPGQAINESSSVFENIMEFKNSIRSVFESPVISIDDRIDNYNHVNEIQSWFKDSLFSNANNYMLNSSIGSDHNQYRFEFLTNNNELFKQYNELTKTKFEIHEGVIHTIPKISNDFSVVNSNDFFQVGLPFLGVVILAYGYNKVMKSEHNFLKQWRNKND